MKSAVALAVLLLVAAAVGFAGEPLGETGGGNEPRRMEKPEAWGTAPLQMEELEVRGLREKPDVLFLPVHRGIDLSSPVRYDLFLGDMERPVDPQGILPGTAQPRP